MEKYGGAGSERSLDIAPIGYIYRLSEDKSLKIQSDHPREGVETEPDHNPFPSFIYYVAPFCFY